MEQTPSCKYYRLLADEYIEGELTGEEMREFEAHIAECPECRKEFEELRALKEALALSNVEIPEGLHERIMNTVSAEMKPKKNKLRPFRRAAISAACAVICLSLTLIFTLMPLWQEGTGSGLPKDPIADATLNEEVLKPDVDLRTEEDFNSSSVSVSETDSIGDANSSSDTDFEPEAMPPDGIDEQTAFVAESTAVGGIKVPDTQAETIVPETAMPQTEAVAVETEIPSAEAPAEATEVTKKIETSTDKAASVTIAPSSDAEAPSAESNSAPGGDEITLALLIVSGLLAVASFIAFLISLSSVRNTPSKKEDGEGK